MGTPGGAVGSKGSRSEPAHEGSKRQASVTSGHLHVLQSACDDAASGRFQVKQPPTASLCWSRAGTSRPSNLGPLHNTALESGHAASTTQRFCTGSLCMWSALTTWPAVPCIASPACATMMKQAMHRRRLHSLLVWHAAAFCITQRLHTQCGTSLHKLHPFKHTQGPA